MKLLSPQPNQTFFHVGPDGTTYTSDPLRLMTPLTVADANALRALGCVDVVEDVEIAVAEPVALASIDEAAETEGDR